MAQAAEYLNSTKLTVGTHYEAFLFQSLKEQFGSLKERLDQEKGMAAKQRSGLEALMTVFFVGYNAVAAMATGHLVRIVLIILLASDCE